MIYLDYNSTTPVDETVLQAMLPYFNLEFGNAASSTHSYGWVASDAVKQARSEVAQLINAEPNELVFTSGATEAVNMALAGVFNKYQSKGNHIVTVTTEHKAVLDTCKYLETLGADITYLNVAADGLVNMQELESAITTATILVCVMYANNETGVIQNIAEIAKAVHAKNSIFMCDATQATGKIKVDVQADGIDLMCMSAHKMYGPKGVGALYVRRKNPRVSLTPLLHGGGHENGLRSGTLNVPGIVGFGKACAIAETSLETTVNRITALRNKFEQALSFYNVLINGRAAPRLPNTANICFKGIENTLLIKTLSGVAVATGSACTSALMQPSHVLKAMGLNDEDSYASIRFSIGKYTTEAELDHTFSKLKTLLT